MKKPKDHIYKLIHTMSPHEKRYLKRHYCNSSNLLTQLYDYINQHKVYSDDAIRNHFSETLMAKNLKVYKVQLKELILKSLHSINYKRDISTKMHLGFMEIDILLNKQLFTLAWQQIQKLKKTALFYEFFEQYLLLLKLEKQLKASEFDLFRPAEAPSSTLKSEIIREMDLTSKVEDITKQFHCHKFFPAHLTPVALSPIDQALLKGVENCERKGFYLSFYYNQCMSRVHLNNKSEYHIVEDFLKRNLDLLDNQYNHIKESNPFLAFETKLDQVNLGSQIIRHPERTKAYIQELNEKISLHKALTIYKLPLLHYEVRLNYFSQNLDAIFNLESSLISWLADNNLEEKPEAISLYLYFCLSYLWARDAQKTFYYLQKIFALNKKEITPIVELTNIIELVANYIFNDLEVLAFRIKALSRYYGKNKNEQFLDFILDSFREICKTPNSKHQPILDVLLGALPQFENETTYKITKIFVFNLWEEEMARKHETQ